ncbi:PREDICTED: uncharacterized protein LOC109486758 isoform X1 [Branchiostoma belcheri]|uniref:Uncharacterized protein LOC109486758 isoform X1 n=1 Tax=Branchiostoma belcheri TaxID=7741 RepID=A0A6P5A9C4_BRABE|nr:PREDICTED: uncharacterized protein LOC109486758 isoform X1 [Branchiostoma belcheri]
MVHLVNTVFGDYCTRVATPPDRAKRELQEAREKLPYLTQVSLRQTAGGGRYTVPVKPPTAAPERSYNIHLLPHTDVTYAGHGQSYPNHKHFDWSRIFLKRSWKDQPRTAPSLYDQSIDVPRTRARAQTNGLPRQRLPADSLNARKLKKFSDHNLRLQQSADGLQLRLPELRPAPRITGRGTVYKPQNPLVHSEITRSSVTLPDVGKVTETRWVNMVPISGPPRGPWSFYTTER